MTDTKQSRADRADAALEKRRERLRIDELNHAIRVAKDGLRAAIKGNQVAAAYASVTEWKLALELLAEPADQSLGRAEPGGVRPPLSGSVANGPAPRRGRESAGPFGDAEPCCGEFDTGSGMHGDECANNEETAND